MTRDFNFYASTIEKEIAKQKFGKSPATLYEPIRYIMSLGGKRLRPLLTLMGYSLYAQDAKKIIKYAIAVEAFHNFTLMHDDIMDKAPLRRGKTTVHKKWSVNTAILSGDVMLIKVYSMLSSMEPIMYKKVVELLNECAVKVCEGQQWDMDFETTDNVTEKEYINMIRLKTAVLLGFSLEFGGVLAGAQDSHLTKLRSFGTNIGIGFQLKDDLLDAYADPKKFGKQVGGDILANKKTYLLIKALELAKGENKKELTRLITQVSFKKKEKVDAVKNIYNDLNIFTMTEKKIKQYFDKGFKDLKNIPVDDSVKQPLIAFTQKLIERQS